MTVRPATAGDAAAIAALYAPYVTAGTISFETVPPDAATIADRMAAHAGLHPWLVAEDDGGTLLAYAYASPFSPRQAYRWTVETTIYVAPAGQRRGVGRRLYGALLATLGARGFAQAIGRISLPNQPSIRLHEALGFRETGVLREVGRKEGRWIDVAYWQRALGEPNRAEPAEPRRAMEPREA